MLGRHITLSNTPNIEKRGNFKVDIMVEHLSIEHGYSLF